MTGNPHLLLGSVRPDGTREVTVTDDGGLILRGEIGPEPASRAHSAQRLTAADLARLIALAGRAPSVHNTQPWTFRSHDGAVELFADQERKLIQVDPAGREMLISCGAALFGLRLGLRMLGYLPRAELLPEPGRPEFVGRVRVAGDAAISRHESELLAAVHHRHTHRGPFAPGEVSARLVAGLRMDAAAEQAELVVLDRPQQLTELIDLVAQAAAEQAADPGIAAELRKWVRPVGTQARDGVPAFGHAPVTPAADPAAGADSLHRWLPRREFGSPGDARSGGHPPSVTAVLTTAGDSPADWIRAGQALHKILLHAASRWVFASLQSQPIESPSVRAQVRARLGLTGEPQLLLQFGRSNTAPAIARRPASETLRGASAGESGAPAGQVRRP
jgi:hypothetical protein